MKDVIPLKQRPFDWLLIIFFAFCVYSSFFISLLRALNVPLIPDSKNIFLERAYWYGSKVDPLFLFNPPWFQIVSGLGSFIYGPFYLLLIYALIKGQNWIRIPTLLYVSAITTSTIITFGCEYLSDSPPLDTPLFLAINLPYLLMPFVLGYRMRHLYPFRKNV